MAAFEDAANEPFLRYLMEPVETDCPIRCPPPERGILHDAQLFKERLNTNIQLVKSTQRELTFLTKKEVQYLLSERQNHLLNDRLIFPSASAPEPFISHDLLE